MTDRVAQLTDRRVALLGATGYTGRLVAAELAASGVPHRLGARDPDRLRALPPSAGGERFVVDVRDADRLRAFLDGVDVLVSCVGPFARLGLPVVQAAVEAAVPYLDSTGEPDFMAEVYRRYADAPTPVVPAMGFDYLPGDLAAAIAIEALGQPAEQVVIGYALHTALPSRGTARSAAGAMRTATATPRRLRIGFPDRDRDAVEVPWGERLTVARHAPGARVATGLVVPAPAAAVLGLLAPLAAVTAPLVRSSAPLLERLADRLPEGPPERRRRASRFALVAQARAGRDVARVHVAGSDVYGLTARFLAEGAQRITGAGALAPAQAVAPRAFLDAVTGPDLTWTPF